MRPFYWILLNAFIWSFGAGLIKARIDWERAVASEPVTQGYTGPVEPKARHSWQVEAAEPNTPHVEPAYPEAEADPNATRRPVKGEDPQFQKPPAFTPFKKGERITCIYDGVFSWSDGNEFMKTVAMDCTVKDASEGWDDELFGDNYQHIQVDCSKGLARKWTSQPGVGMVKDHALNFKVRWMTSRECYHFVTED